MAITSRVTLRSKTCIKCRMVKPNNNEFFPKRKGVILRNECKKCNSRYQVTWSENNRVRSREIKAKYAKANPEKHRGDIENDNRRSKEWREKNPEAFKLNIRKAHLQTTYGLTLEDYDNMLNDQNGSCAICGTTDTGKWKHFCVDHNHNTGEIRSLLCKSCNFLVGTVEGKRELLNSAKHYVERYSFYDYQI